MGEPMAGIGPGHRVALNLVGVEHGDVERGDVVVRPESWRPTRMFDASLSVLASLAHDVSRRGAYTAHIGSGQWPVRLRVLGEQAIAAGDVGMVRLHLPVPLPLLPGDRYVLRESGRAETVGGGEVLDIAPVLSASRARPDRSVDRVIGERGWVAVDELEALTGERRPPTLGRWVGPPGAREAVVAELAERVRAAGPIGIDLATLDARARAAVVEGHTSGVVVDGERLRAMDAPDPIADHPWVAALERGGATPPGPEGGDPTVRRQLVRRGLVVERDGVWFHPSAVDSAARLVAGLLAASPEGITVAQVREALGATRKHVVPLLTELDARGITRRRGDVRIAGPRLP